VRITLPVRRDIRSGGFADAAFGAGSAPVRTLPETAIRYDAEGSSVMVVGSDNRVSQAQVKIGARGGGLVEIVSGVPAGARVLERAASLVLPGDLVNPVTASGAAAPAKAPAAK
jgi:HlyD family secretion protein